jgi:hypothetical protein
MKNLLKQKALIPGTNKSGTITSIGNYNSPEKMIIVVVHKKTKVLVYGLDKLVLIGKD